MKSILLLFLLGLGANANTIVYNSLGNSNDGQDLIANSGTDPNGNAARGPAFNLFVSGGNATGSVLTDLQLALYAAHTTDLGSVTVGLYNSGAGPVPGSLIATLGTIHDSEAVDCIPGPLGACLNAPRIIDLSGLSAALSPHTQYWIGLSEGASGTSILWSWSIDTATGVGVPGGCFTNNTGTYCGTDNYPYLMQVTTLDSQLPGEVPEPVTLFLVAVGAIIVGLARRS